MFYFGCGNSFVECIEVCTKESGKKKRILVVVVTRIKRNKSVVAGNFFHLSALNFRLFVAYSLGA